MSLRTVTLVGDDTLALGEVRNAELEDGTFEMRVHPVMVPPTETMLDALCAGRAGSRRMSRGPRRATSPTMEKPKGNSPTTDLHTRTVPRDFESAPQTRPGVSNAPSIVPPAAPTQPRQEAKDEPKVTKAKPAASPPQAPATQVERPATIETKKQRREREAREATK